MNKLPKVVSFERPPEYLHHRAMLNRRENRTVDAVELLRRAVEASPDNSEYRLDLAELYCEMGCHTQSARLLLDMMAEGEVPSECYYGLAMNQLGLRDIHAARLTLDHYKCQEPEGAHSDELDALFDDMALYLRGGERPADRKRYRAQKIADRACEALKSDMPEKACRLFEAAFKHSGKLWDMRALYAMALYMAGNGERAREQADRVCGARKVTVRAMCVCAQVYHMLGDADKPGQLMDAAEREQPDAQELRLMLYSASEMGMHERTAEYARRCLQETPHDREVLHMRAVAMKRCGASDAEAGRYWTRIVRLDPEDSVALYYADAASRGALDEVGADYGYQVPEAEYLRRVTRLADVLAEGMETLHDHWVEDAEFRRLVRWTLYGDEPQLSKTAAFVLCTVDDPEANSMLREMMFRPDVSKDLKVQVVSLNRALERELDVIMPSRVQGMGSALVDIDGLLKELPVGERQLVRYADEVLTREYDVHALPMLAMLWTGYRKARAVRCEPLTRMESSAAALAYSYMVIAGMGPDLDVLAKQFRCDLRQLVFCCKWMQGVMNKKIEGESDEDIRF